MNQIASSSKELHFQATHDQLTNIFNRFYLENSLKNSLKQENEYGYCNGCGIEIGLKRLEARPTATLCIDCKTLDEMRERQVAK